MSDKILRSPLTKPNSYIGRTLSRAGAKRAVAGRGRYTDDVSLPRMLHAAFLRSPFAHARILAIDAAEARRQPGVALVMTGAELAKLCTGPWVGTLTCFPGMKSAPQYPLAVDRACWVGEPVAMVVAAHPRRGRGRSRAHRVEWQELPAVTDKKTALDARHARLHAELGDNLAFRKTIDTGAVDAAFAKADLVIEDTFEFGRHTAVSLEPRALLAAYDKGTGKLTITTSSQCPHMIQHVFARHAGRARTQCADHRARRRRLVRPQDPHLRRRVGDRGRGIQLGRPVKFIADRLESFVSDIHARENTVKARIAVSKSGTIEAFDIDVLSGAGAYSQYPRTSVFEATQVLNITGGPYRHKHYRARATVVYQNKLPTSQYRAVGHPIGNTVGEHLVDRAAYGLGIDPIEIRRRNIMPDDAYPGNQRQRHQAQGPVAPALPRRPGRAHELRGACARSRRGCAAKGIHRGIGIASFIKGTAPGPARLLRHRRRADLPAGRLRHQARAQRRRHLRGRRHRAGPGHRHRHGPDRRRPRSACPWRACA